MKLAFCLFKYYPFGGLERDFLRIAKTCQQRGHVIDVYVMRWQGEMPEGFNIHVLPVRGLSNHGRCKKFAALLQPHLKKNHYDVVIGFNRMPGLDVYFAADPCYQTSALRKHGRWYRFTPRFRHYAALEQAVFAPSAATEILLLTQAEQANFVKCYHTPEERFHEIPPGIADDRRIPVDAQRIRDVARAEFNIAHDTKLILMIGSDFKRKGVDRSLYALASLPTDVREKVKLFVIGKGDEQSMQRLAQRLHIEEQVRFLGARQDALRFLLAADVLLHPAYQETAGMVLLEAIVAGLPILVTANCGYAFYVERAQAGLLINTPYRQEDLNNKLLMMLTTEKQNTCKMHALAYAQAVNLFGMSEAVADIIETIAKRKH